MFTGIIEEIGIVKAIQQNGNNSFIVIQAKKVLEDVNIGDSIAVNGVCLTVTFYDTTVFHADVMNETLNRSSLSKLKIGSQVNLERAMSANGRFGGHIVSGHIDGTGIISDIQNDGIAVWYTISAESSLLRYIVEKGSIAIDGISLTVVEVTDNSFSVSVIPHTANVTILSSKKKGSVVNLETDIIGKYVDKLACFNKTKENRSGITLDFLAKNGF